MNSSFSEFFVQMINTFCSNVESSHWLWLSSTLISLCLFLTREFVSFLFLLFHACSEWICFSLNFYSSFEHVLLKCRVFTLAVAEFNLGFSLLVFDARVCFFSVLVLSRVFRMNSSFSEFSFH